VVVFRCYLLFENETEKLKLTWTVCAAVKTESRKRGEKQVLGQSAAFRAIAVPLAKLEEQLSCSDVSSDLQGQ
jgi:hypothetical protein